MSIKTAKRTIIAAAKDAGGCNSLVPVINRFKRANRVVTIADHPASDIFSRNNIKVDILKSRLSKIELDELFLKESPVLTLLGTSWGDSVEDNIVEGASRHNIASIGILDSWLRYDERFSKNGNRWFYLPDYLIVMDENAKRDMIKLGAPKDRIFPIGNPYFDNIRKKGEMVRKELKAKALRSRGRIVLFLSEPNSLFNRSSGPAHLGRLGYDEFCVLRDLADIVKKIEARRKTKIKLLLKLHPAEKGSDKYRDFVDRKEVEVVDGELQRLMLRADLVAGMESMALVEACILGIINVSYQPGLKRKDMLLTNRLRVGQFCYSKKRCEEKIEKLLFDKISRKASIDRMKSFVPKTDITDKVVEFIYSVIDARSRI